MERRKERDEGGEKKLRRLRSDHRAFFLKFRNGALAIAKAPRACRPAEVGFITSPTSEHYANFRHFWEGLLRSIDQSNEPCLLGSIGRVGQAHEEVGEDIRSGRRCERVRCNHCASGAVGRGVGGCPIGDWGPDRPQGIENVEHQSNTTAAHVRAWGVRGQVEQPNAGARLGRGIRSGDNFNVVGIRWGPVVLGDDDEGAWGEGDGRGQELLARCGIVDGDDGIAHSENLDPMRELGEGVILPFIHRRALGDLGIDLVGGRDGVPEPKVRLVVGRQGGGEGWRWGGRRRGRRRWHQGGRVVAQLGGVGPQALERQDGSVHAGALASNLSRNVRDILGAPTANGRRCEARVAGVVLLAGIVRGTAIRRAVVLAGVTQPLGTLVAGQVAAPCAKVAPGGLADLL
jgi:hypothetical protein